MLQLGRSLIRDHLLNVAPGKYLRIRALPGIIAAIYNPASNTMGLTRTFHAISEALEVFEKVSGRGGTRFDFDGIKFFSLLDEKVDFRSAGLPIVKQIWLYTAVNECFVGFLIRPKLSKIAPRIGWRRS